MATGAEEIRRKLGESGGFRRIELAHESPFRMGPLIVEPALRRIAHIDGGEEIIEPRVMQVLAALRRAEGAILSRSDLTECCWEGRVVGDDAINRVLSRLRRLSETIGRDVFRIETITKVGYRLLLEPGVDIGCDVSAAPPVKPSATGSKPAPRGRTSRRKVLGGAFAAAAAAATPMVWKAWTEEGWPSPFQHVPKPEAKRLYEEGMKAQYQAIDATSEQAEAYFRQAAEADPEWADAWGSLAMSYRHMMDGETNVSQWRLVEQTRSAARRALELDPDNEEALVALALIRSPWRRWSETEAVYRPLVERFPRAFVLRGHYSRLLRDLGRFDEAVELTRVTFERHPFIVYPALGHLLSLWGAGRLHEAEAMMDLAYRRWPKNVAVWFLRADFLTYTGRTGAAAGFAADREGWPAGLPELVTQRRAIIARALQTRAAPDVDAAINSMSIFIERSLSQAPYIIAPQSIVPFFTAIGDLDDAYEVLFAYYFDRGRYAAPVRRSFGPLTRRDTSLLFMPHMAALRRDRRFGPLLEEIGLEDHWRRTSKVPDFRRATA